MAQPVTMPKFGQMVEESSISKWLKREGDAVRKGDILFEAETDKATMEVESFAEGTLLRILVPEGQTVPVLSVVGYIGEPGEQLAVPEAPPREAATPGADGSTKAGEESGAQAAGAARSASRRNISPRAARLAQELGLDVSLLTGTGPEGRVVEADVERARAARAERPEPPSRMRRIIAERLTESYRTAPHFFTTQSVDMTELEALRAELKGAGLKYSLNDFILKAVALALIEHPPVNGAAGKSSAGHVHLGMAVALEDGLVAPVIREAERLTLDQVHSAAEELAAKARAGKLTPDEMSGSTFTVSNLGMLDVENFTAIINPGESAILAISSVRQQPAVFGGQIAIRRLMKITLSADHRSIDGAVAAGFINSVRAKLQDGELWRSAAGR